MEDLTARAASLQAGEQVGHYTVVERIGVGGFGEVYRARHEKIGREVAVKLLHEKYSSDSAAIARFIAEARAVNRVSHPNIIEVHDFGELASGRSYFVMELLTGRTLREVMRDRVMSVAEATPILNEIASALAAVHEVGIAHRDLKPDNVFVLPSGRVKLIDFGLAKLVHVDGSAPTETGTIAGTPLYMSPEQLRGSSVDTRTDSYSFGVLAYQMLVGEPPFSGPDALAIALKHMNDKPIALSARRPELAIADAPILALLSKDPAARPTPSDAVSSLMSPVTPTVRRAARPWWIVGGVAVIACAIAVVIWSRSEPTPLGTRFAIVARPQTATDDAWFAPPLARMLSSRLTARERRAYQIVPDAEASRVDVEYHREGQTWTVVATIEDREVARGSGTSIAQAVDVLARLLAPVLDDGRSPAPADAAELVEMARIGAPDVVAYRRYAALRDDFDRSWFIDPVPVIAELQNILRDHPRWLYPCLELVRAQGLGGVEGTATLASCRTRDATLPVPAAILAAMQPKLPASEGQRLLLAVPGIRKDRLAQYSLWTNALFLSNLDDAASFTNQRATERPDLQYGLELLQILHRAGRDSDAETFSRRWAMEHPEAEHSLLELITLEARAGNRDVARTWMARRRLLLGESISALGILFDGYVVLDDFYEAHRIVERMLASGGLTGAKGRYRMGLIAIFEGRFAAAYDTLNRARAEMAPYGLSNELTQVLTTLRSIAPLVGAPGDGARLHDATIEAFSFEAGVTAALRYEREVSRSDRCPSIEAELAPLTDEGSRSTTRRRMLRAGIAAGCSKCADVVTAGMSADEANSESLLAFASCAEEAGDLDLARRAIERASITTSLLNEPSPYHATIAGLRLARVVAKQGQLERARALYTRFIERWSKADRSLPEVAQAKAELAALGKTP